MKTLRSFVDRGSSKISQGAFLGKEVVEQGVVVCQGLNKGLLFGDVAMHLGWGGPG